MAESLEGEGVKEHSPLKSVSTSRLLHCEILKLATGWRIWHCQDFFLLHLLFLSPWLGSLPVICKLDAVLKIV